MNGAKTDYRIEHLPPNTDRFNTVGLAAAVQCENVEEMRRQYIKNGTVPNFPSFLYEVKGQEHRGR